MDRSSITPPQTRPDVGVYECEVHLKFRLIEEGTIFQGLDERGLLEVLLESYSYGADEYLEPLQVEIRTEIISELLASPQMRRQLLRLRNASDDAA